MFTQPKSKLIAASPYDPTTECVQPPRPQTMGLLSALTGISMLASLAYMSFRFKSVMAMPQPDNITLTVLFIEISTAGLYITPNCNQNIILIDQLSAPTVQAAIHT